MTVRTITGNINTLAGLDIPYATFSLVPETYVFGSTSLEVIFGELVTVEADANGDVSFDLHEGKYVGRISTSQGAKSFRLTVDSEGPWTLGRLIGALGDIDAPLVAAAFDAADRAEAAAVTAVSAAAGVESPISYAPQSLNTGQQAQARDNIGLGTIATQDAGDVAITGGTVDGAAITGGTVDGAAITGGTVDGAAITGLADGVEPDDAATVGQTLGNPFALKPLAEPFPIWDHIPNCPIPDNSGDVKFIRLTAGESGVGEYNEGLLTDEQVSGSAPLVEATAEIAIGPMAGQRVPLINTEMSFIRPGTDSGALQFDQMQGHWHLVRDDADSPVGIDESAGAAGTGNRARRSGIDNGPYLARAIIEGAHGAPRVGVETRSKNRQATYYMRVV